MRLLAIDPANKCGWAHSSGASGTWDLSVRRDESSGMRLLRLAAKLGEIHSGVGIDVVVFEAARHSAPKMQGALVAQAEIQGQIKVWCERANVEYRGYSPAEIKKHATGKGNAGKDAVMEAARSRGWNPQDDNEADALWLLDLATISIDTHSDITTSGEVE